MDSQKADGCDLWRETSSLCLSFLPAVASRPRINHREMAPEEKILQLSDRDKQFQQYFTALAPNYHHLTSNTTYLIAQKALELAPIPTDPSALIHDNACGPGTATLAILEHCKTNGTPIPNILATDYTPAMIDATPRHPNLQTSIQDSQALPYPSNHFSYTIINISLANFTSPSHALREAFRTAKSNSPTVVTHWKLFAPSVLLHRAQEIFHGEPQPQPPVAGRDLMQKGVIAGMMVEAGWARERVETHVVELRSGKTEGMVEFLTGPYLPVVRNLAEGEREAWRRAVERAVREAGEVRCEGWVVIGRK